MAGTNDFRQVNVSSGLGALGLVTLASALDTLIQKINKDYQDRGQKVEIFASSIPPMGYPREGSGPTVTHTLLNYLNSQRTPPCNSRRPKRRGRSSEVHQRGERFHCPQEAEP